MTLQEKIKELAERLDKQSPCPISGQCFLEVMSSGAAFELFEFILKEYNEKIKSRLSALGHTGANNDNTN